MKAEGMRAVIDVSKHIMCPEVKPHSSSSQMTPSSEEMVDLTMVPDSPVSSMTKKTKMCAPNLIISFSACSMASANGSHPRFS